MIARRHCVERSPIRCSIPNLDSRFVLSLLHSLSLLQQTKYFFLSASLPNTSSLQHSLYYLSRNLSLQFTSSLVQLHSLSAIQLSAQSLTHTLSASALCIPLYWIRSFAGLFAIKVCQSPTGRHSMPLSVHIATNQCIQKCSLINIHGAKHVNIVSYPCPACTKGVLNSQTVFLWRL